MDLLPFFQTYATLAFDAEAIRQSSRIFAAGKQGRRRLLAAIGDSVVNAIVKPGGVWERAARESGQLVNLGGWRSEFGEYGIENFVRPHRMPIKATVRSCATNWIIKKLQQPTASLANPPQNLKGTGVSGKSVPFPNRAKWLDSHRLGMNFSIRHLADRASVDPKTVRRVRSGKSVHEKSLIAIAGALKVKPADVPND